MIELGIRDGKIVADDRAGWERDFAADFKAANERLAAAKPFMKTRPTVDLSGRGAAPKPSDQFLVAVNERMKFENAKLPEDERYALAWNHCATVSHKALFDQMAQPAKTFTK